MVCCVQLAQVLGYRKPGAADPHSSLNARHHASKVSPTSQMSIVAVSLYGIRCLTVLLGAEQEG